MFEDLEEMFSLKSGAENVASQHSSRINYTVNYEVTLNPSNTKVFDSSEEQYMQLFRKLLQYIHTAQESFVQVIDSKYTFEYCKSGKRHLHGYITVKPKQVISPMGLVYDLSEYVAKLLRRKIKDSQCYPDFARVQTLPFCIQMVNIDNTVIRPNWTKDIKNWDGYIKKDT